MTETPSKDDANWHKMAIQDRETSRCGCHIPWTKRDIGLILGSAPKEYASRYYQLKVGHDAVGTYLARIKVIETPKCWWCEVAEQTVEHLYTRCHKWKKQRRRLVREFEKSVK